MGKGMDWEEYSKHSYRFFGRDKPYGCACGTNLFGASGVCRICGKYKGRARSQSRRPVLNCCWSDDLYELCRPLLDPNVKLNHSEQQYALRAVRQRLKATPWDWKGPDKPLKCAIDADNAELVLAMLEAGMDPREANARGVTALHTAAFAGRVVICRLLLDGHANVNSLDCHGQTPLFFGGTVEICDLLYEQQADVTLVNSKGQTALHHAGRAGFRDVLDWFSKRCTKDTQNLRDLYGATAKHYLLLSCPHPVDEGLSPSSTAKRRGGRAKSERRWLSRVGSSEGMEKEKCYEQARHCRTPRFVTARSQRDQDTDAEDAAAASLAQQDQLKMGVEPNSRDAQEAAAYIAELEEKLQAQLEERKEMEAKAKASRSAVDLIARLKHIEASGRISVDMNNGQIEILKPLEFVARTKGPNPTAELADMSSADPILADVAEIATILSVPIEIQVHTAKSPNQLAQSQAELIMEQLILRGVERRLITSTGHIVGSDGKIVVKLDLVGDIDFF